MANCMNPERIISDIKRIVESDKRSDIRLKANGGNSILIVCHPEQEALFTMKLKELLEEDEYVIIDLNELLISFVDHTENLMEWFDLLRSSIHQIFKSPEGEESDDLFSLILTRIAHVFSENKIPVLIHTGALYGSGIDNIHLMENELVMKSNKPLLILYPATIEGDRLMFLSARPASKYRCMIV